MAKRAIELAFILGREGTEGKRPGNRPNLIHVERQ